MPTKRTRRSRKPVSDFSPELVAWIRGEGPFTVEVYFLGPGQLDRLRALHGIPGVEPRERRDD